MRVFLAGASGAIGRRLVPLLVADGHQVTGTSRTPQGVAALRGLGADAVQVDVFDADALVRAVADASPDAVMHQLTALSEGSSARNAEIRRTGTANLVRAAREVGVDRIVAQSISWAYRPGDGPASEDTPLDLTADGPRAVTVGGVQALEEQVATLGTAVVLRYGTLYGPGTWYAPDGSVAEQARAGKLSATDAVSSFLHVDDAAQAAVAALGWPAGTVNVVDDEPAPARDWLPVYAQAVGAPPPAVGSGGAGWERGARNAVARGLGWEPAYPSWRTGFATQL